MEVYILDSLLRRDQVIDRFESLIWTERFSSYGDFELLLHSTQENRKRFTVGTRLALNESYRVMVVETVEDKTDSEGRRLLMVKGRSLEVILEDRTAKYNLRSVLIELNLEQDWVLIGSPITVVNTLFNTICRQGRLSPLDVIPFLAEGNIFPDDTIPEVTNSIVWRQNIDTLYNAIKGVCDAYDLGFRLIRNFDTSQLYFNAYTGSDRTTRQSILPPVIFAPELDNLQNTTEFTTIEQAKNVAYVFSKFGTEIIYPEDVDPEVDGFERHILNLVITDIPDDEVDPIGFMIQRGREELAKNRGWFGFDGELDQHSHYKYGVHYNLGDIVEMRNADGISNSMRVTEQIFVSDREGERSYPTLTVNMVVNPGAWLSWAYNQVWADLGPTEYWADQA